MYGFHRVVIPKGTVPQAAEVVDNTPKILHPDEMLVSVHILNLDSTSMRQLRENYDNIPERIKEIINTRGKMHNPMTNSGGVMIGRVKKFGKHWKSGCNLKKGEWIIPLVSLSAIPMCLSEISEIRGDMVMVEGSAILFKSYSYVVPPCDISLDVALSALDISSLVPQVERSLRVDDKVLIMGCGKAGLTAMAVVRQLSPNSVIYGIDFSDKQIEIVKRLGYASCIEKINAQNAEEVHDFIATLTKGQGVDLVLNCVNVPNTETGAILATRDRGTIVFFSMATKFDQAALGTDATGKDVTMIIGNGVAEGQAEKMFNLLRRDAKLREYFENLHK